MNHSSQNEYDPRLLGGPRTTRPRLLHEFLLVPVRSFIPLLALVLICGTVAWGPWVTLGLAYVSWDIASRIA